MTDLISLLMQGARPARSDTVPLTEGEGSSTDAFLMMMSELAIDAPDHPRVQMDADIADGPTDELAIVIGEATILPDNAATELPVPTPVAVPVPMGDVPVPSRSDYAIPQPPPPAELPVAKPDQHQAVLPVEPDRITADIPLPEEGVLDDLSIDPRTARDLPADRVRPVPVQQNHQPAIAPSAMPVAEISLMEPDLTIDPAAPMASAGSPGAAPAPATSVLTTSIPMTTMPMTPEAARTISAQISGAIDVAADGVVELRLDPPELGHVRLNLTMGDAGLSANLSAERPEIEALLRRHADLLHTALENAGFGDVDLSFAKHQQDGASDDAAIVLADLDEAAAVTHVSGPTMRASGQLDIRL